MIPEAIKSEKNLEALYKSLDGKIGLGTQEEFNERMASPKNRKALYDAVQGKHLDLGTPEEYESRIAKKKDDFGQGSSQPVEVVGAPSEQSGQDTTEPRLNALKTPGLSLGATGDGSEQIQAARDNIALDKQAKIDATPQGIIDNQKAAMMEDFTERSASIKSEINIRLQSGEITEEQANEELQTVLKALSDSAKQNYQMRAENEIAKLPVPVSEGAPQEEKEFERNPFKSFFFEAKDVLFEMAPSAFRGMQGVTASSFYKTHTKELAKIADVPDDEKVTTLINGEEVGLKAKDARSYHQGQQGVQMRTVMKAMQKELDNMGADRKTQVVKDLRDIDSFNSGMNFVAGALGQSVAQIPLAVATMGMSSFFLEAGSIYSDGIREIIAAKSEELGRQVTLEEVMENGWDEPVAAVAFGALAAGLDLIGAKAVTGVAKKEGVKMIRKNFAKEAAKKAATEGVTESAQSTISQFGTGIVAKKKIADSFADIDPMQALSEGAAGLVGGGGIGSISARSEVKSHNQQIQNELDVRGALKKALKKENDILIKDAVDAGNKDEAKIEGAAQNIVNKGIDKVAAETPGAEKFQDIKPTTDETVTETTPTTEGKVDQAQDKKTGTDAAKQSPKQEKTTKPVKDERTKGDTKARPTEKVDKQSPKKEEKKIQEAQTLNEAIKAGGETLVKFTERLENTKKRLENKKTHPSGLNKNDTALLKKVDKVLGRVEEENLKNPTIKFVKNKAAKLVESGDLAQDGKNFTVLTKKGQAGIKEIVALQKKIAPTPKTVANIQQAQEALGKNKKVEATKLQEAKDELAKGLEMFARVTGVTKQVVPVDGDSMAAAIKHVGNALIKATEATAENVSAKVKEYFKKQGHELTDAQVKEGLAEATPKATKPPKKATPTATKPTAKATPTKKIFNNESVFSEKSGVTQSGLKDALSKEDQKYQKKASRLALQESARILKENPLEEVKKAVLDKSNGMIKYLRLHLQLQVAYAYIDKGDLETGYRLIKDQIKEKGKSAAETSIPLTAKDHVEKIMLDGFEANEEINDKVSLNQKTNGENIETFIKDANEIATGVIDEAFIDEVTKEALREEGRQEVRGKKKKKSKKDREKKRKELEARNKKLDEELEALKAARKKPKGTILNSSIIGLTDEDFTYYTAYIVNRVKRGVTNSQKILNELISDLRKDNLPILTKKQQEGLKEIFREELFKNKKGRVKKAIQEAVGKSKADNVSVRQALEAALTEAGIDPKKSLAKFDKKLREEMKGKVEALLTTKDKNPSTGDIRTHTDKVIEAINNGALDTQETQQIFADKFQYTSLTGKQAAEAKRLAELLQILPEGEEQKIAQQDFDQLQREMSAKDSEFYGSMVLELFYTGMLSGPSTLGRALKGATMTGLYHITVAGMANPHAMFGNWLGGFRALGGGMWTGALSIGEIIRTGNAPLEFYASNPKGKGKMNALINRTPVETYKDFRDSKGLGGAAMETAKLATYIVFVLPVVMVRTLVAADAVFKYGIKDMEQYIASFNELLAGKDGNGRTWFRKTSGDFYTRLNTKLGKEKSIKEAAALQVKNEIEDRRKRGVNKSWGYRRRREADVREAMSTMSEGAKTWAHEQSLAGVLMNEPVGRLGDWYRRINSVGLTKKGDSFEGVTNAVFFRFIFPFMRVPTNMVNEFVNYTPLGVVRAVKAASFGRIDQKGQRVKNADEVARIALKAVIGNGMGALLASMLFEKTDDDDENWLKLREDAPIRIHGAGNYFAGRTKDLGYKSFSIQYKKSNGEWSDFYSYIDNPLGMVFASLGTIYDELEYDDFQKQVKAKDPNYKNIEKRNLQYWAKAAAWNMSIFATSQSYSQGMKLLSEIMSDNEKTVGKALKKLAINPLKAIGIPAVYRQTNNAYKIYKQVPEYAAVTWGDELVKGVPFLESYLLTHLKYDEFGYPMVRGPEVPFQPDFGFEEWKNDRLSVMKNKKEWQLVHKYSKVNLGNQMYYAPVTLDDVRMTTSEASEYTRVRGKIMSQLTLKYYDKIKDYDELNLQVFFDDIMKSSKKAAKEQIRLLRLIEKESSVTLKNKYRERLRFLKGSTHPVLK